MLKSKQKILIKVKPNILHLVTIKPVILGLIALRLSRLKPHVLASISGMGYIFVSKGIKNHIIRFIVINLYKIALSYRKLNVIFQNKSDIILLGVSRTSKTPTSIYLANKGFKTSNIPLINENSIPNLLKEKPKLKCVVGLTVEPKRLIDVRKNRMIALKEEHGTDYTNIEKIEIETNNAKEAFKKYQWPVIDVTRKSIEETAASIIKIYEIKNQNA